MHSAAFSSLTPPIASTGILTTRQISPNRAMPCGSPIPRLDGVSNTGPKKMYAAPARSASRASARLWHETPTKNSAGACPPRHQLTTSRAPSDSRPRCTPAAPAASATSNRSFTITRAPPAAVTDSRASPSSSCADKSFSRICTQSTPAAIAARIFPSTPAPASPAASDFRSVT